MKLKDISNKYNNNIDPNINESTICVKQCYYKDNCDSIAEIFINVTKQIENIILSILKPHINTLSTLICDNDKYIDEVNRAIGQFITVISDSLKEEVNYRPAA